MTDGQGTGDLGQYHGIQGTTWSDPPILDDPDEPRTVVGRRRLQLYRDRQMLATAQSLTRLEQASS